MWSSTRRTVRIEACATSHHWSRQLKAIGHNRATDAAGLGEALCQAAEKRCRRRRGDVRSGQQAKHAVRGDQDPLTAEPADAPPHPPSLHSATNCRDQLDPRASCRVWDRGTVGRQGVEDLLDVIADPMDRRVPEVARACVAARSIQLRMLKAQVLEFDCRIMAWHRSNETSRRLDEIPGRSGLRNRLWALPADRPFAASFPKLVYKVRRAAERAQSQSQLRWPDPQRRDSSRSRQHCRPCW